MWENVPPQIVDQALFREVLNQQCATGCWLLAASQCCELQGLLSKTQGGKRGRAAPPRPRENSHPGFSRPRYSLTFPKNKSENPLVPKPVASSFSQAGSTGAAREIGQHPLYM